MTQTRSRLTAVMTVAALMLFSFANLAIAQTSSTEVSVSTAEGTRLLSVTDLANQPLEAMALQPGVPKAYRVRVDDDALNTLQQNPFTVDGVLNNLYLKTETGHDFDTMIPSGQVVSSFLPDPVDATGLLADISPDYLLSSTQKLTCDGVLGGVLELNLLNLALLDPVYQTLCSSLGGLLSLDATAGVDVTDVPVAGEIIAGVDLTSLDVSELPIVASLTALQLEGGAFDDADYSAGTIGADDPSASGAPDATMRRLLNGGLNTDLSALLALLGPIVDALDVVGLDGSGAMMTVSDAVAAMRASADAEVAGFADALSQLTASEQLDVLDALFTAVLEPLGLEDILSLSAFYTSLPRLTADAADAAPGEYAGTLTIRLTED